MFSGKTLNLYSTRLAWIPSFSTLAIWLIRVEGYKTLIWGVPFGVIISILASGVRLRLANTLPPKPPPQTLPTWTRRRRLLQLKLVDAFIQLNVSFRRRNGSQSACQQLRETLLLDGDAWCLSEIHENNTFPSRRGNLEGGGKRSGRVILVILSL